MGAVPIQATTLIFKWIVIQIVTYGIIKFGGDAGGSGDLLQSIELALWSLAAWVPIYGIQLEVLCTSKLQIISMW